MWVPITLILIIYAGILVVVCIHIVLTTPNTGKALSYLLFALFIPLIGMGFYLIFGVNYLNKRRYGKKLQQDQLILKQIKDEVVHLDDSGSLLQEGSIGPFSELAAMLTRSLSSPLTQNNSVTLLQNGEKKFPELIDAIKQAKHHIHLEYYILRVDNIGKHLLELLMDKAGEGIEVRLIYDDFGSPAIDDKLMKRMQAAGVALSPFYQIKFYLLANRYNYRNHRKIVVIDGQTAFVGGINVADHYINNEKSEKYWRDTHVRIDGPAVYYLQYLFISDWKFCCGEVIKSTDYYFPKTSPQSGSTVQIAASGPDAVEPIILYSILQTIYLAKKEILITTPYFIPENSFINALCIAGQIGLSVKILVPKTTDSKIADAAANSYYAQLLRAGVEIFQYHKGFLHAKTMVADATLAMIGTANIDNRSFELNFEVNAVIYDKSVAQELRATFYNDLKESVRIDKESWLERPWQKRLPEKLARLCSPIL